MNLLILATPARLTAVEAALDSADPLGAPYQLIRQVSRQDDELVHYAAGYLASPPPEMAQAIIDAVTAVDGGVIVLVDRETVEDALSELGVGHRLRPSLPDDPPTKHADFDALDAARGITTSGTLSDRWEAHLANSSR